MLKAIRERSVVLLALSLIGAFGLHFSEARAEHPTLLETREIVSLLGIATSTQWFRILPTE